MLKETDGAHFSPLVNFGYLPEAVNLLEVSEETFFEKKFPGTIHNSISESMILRRFTGFCFVCSLRQAWVSMRCNGCALPRLTSSRLAETIVFRLLCRCSLPGTKNSPSITSHRNRAITAHRNHCFHASVQVLPSRNQKFTKYNISPKSGYHSSPKPLFSCFSAGASFPEPKTHPV